MPRSAQFPDAAPVEQLPWFAVAVTNFRFLHAGILFRGKDGVMLLHLRGHEDVAVEKAIDSVPGAYAWAVPGYNDMVLRQLAGFAKVHAKKLPKVPFSFRYAPAEYRYVRGGAVQMEGLNGFTCATYVLSILDWLKLPLLDYSQWRLRPVDEADQRYILPYIKAPPEHIAKVAADIPCLRFRPQEVAAACLLDNYPVAMDEAEPHGKQLLQDLDGYYIRAGVI